jgi:hypothetical protein
LRGVVVVKVRWERGAVGAAAARAVALRLRMWSCGRDVVRAGWTKML